MTTDADSKNSGRCACGVIPLYAKGMCARCYKQSRKPAKKKKEKIACKCGRPFHARGMCSLCYNRAWRTGAVEITPPGQHVPPEEFVRLAKDAGLYGGSGWQRRLGWRLGTTDARISQIVSGGATTRTLEKWREKLRVCVDAQSKKPATDQPESAMPAPALLTHETGFVATSASLDEPLTDLLDELGIPDEDSNGFRLELKERLRELKWKWGEMKARDKAYGHKEPVEELLRVQAALLHKEHPDAHAAHFVREVCRLFDFSEPPPMPDNLWYRTALAVIRERVVHLEWPWKDPSSVDTSDTKSS